MADEQAVATDDQALTAQEVHEERVRADTRGRYSQMVDLIRGGASDDELEQVNVLLRPFAAKVQARL